MVEFYDEKIIFNFKNLKEHKVLRKHKLIDMRLRKEVQKTKVKTNNINLAFRKLSSK
mgnify:CR=1 FL=1